MGRRPVRVRLLTQNITLAKKRRETTMAGKADLRRSRANNLSIWLLSCTALLAVSACKSMAQSAAAEPGLEDIIVTAEKRAENVQRVPLSIFAVTGEALEAAGVTGPLDLPKLVPS